MTPAESDREDKQGKWRRVSSSVKLLSAFNTIKGVERDFKQGLIFILIVSLNMDTHTPTGSHLFVPFIAICFLNM